MSRIPHSSGNLPDADVTNVTASSNPGAQPGAVAQPRSSHFGAYLGGFLLVSLALGLLIAYDLSHFFAERAQEFIFDEEGTAEKDPVYEEAERVWADGKHLEAIQLMRDFLASRPQAQYAALRIAEIYEKDLRNHVAAALELEEVLKKKLPPDRWGWTAIHLANLYSGKMNKPAQAEALLKRIVDEYPDTPAAKKAREHLGIPEPVPQMAGSSLESGKDDSSKLPPGFRPKG